jgi:DNA-binding NtrC family response regulator
MRQILCITLGNAEISDGLPDGTGDWKFQNVSGLADARCALRSNYYTVGLLLHTSGQVPAAEIDSFLRQYSDMQWVGVFKTHDLASEACCDLILQYLCDYHTFPIDPVRLVYTLGHAHGWAMLRQTPNVSSMRTGDDAWPLVGDCEAMTRLRAQVMRIAKVTAPALIWGESGSGKELTAQAIHAHSRRATGPFVPINCGAVAASLIHSELFGYERGAFTGAICSKAGLIESANGGTLFLDEIGDLPKDLQANLLRFLQEKTICRLGSARNIHVDVRVVAATHVQLEQAVVDGSFREDLYYRLAVLPVTVPPLRERRGDLVALAEHFFHRYASENSSRPKGFSNQAIAAILKHTWPGNVRELINRVRCALVMSDGGQISPEDLGLERNDAIIAFHSRADARTRGERSALRECLDRSGQNVSRAARDLGVSRTTIYRMLNKYGMHTS